MHETAHLCHVTGCVYILVAVGKSEKDQCNMHVDLALPSIHVLLHHSLYFSVLLRGTLACTCAYISSHMVQVVKGGIPSGFHHECVHSPKLPPPDDCTFLRMIRLRKKTLQIPNSW